MTAPEVTPAIERAAKKYANLTGSGMRSALLMVPLILASTLDVEEMTRAILPTLDNYWCGDHVEYHETDDDGETLPCCVTAREEQARSQVTTLRTAIIGTDQ